MFAPQIANPQTKPTADSSNLESPSAAQTALGYSPIGQMMPGRRASGDRARWRSNAQQISRPRQESAAENMASAGERHDAAWNFGRIPVFPTRRASQSRPPFAPAAAPLPGALQAKLVVGEVNDPLEHEADSVADRVVNMPNPQPAVAAAAPQVSRKCAKCQEEESAPEQTKQLSRKCAKCQDEELRTQSTGVPRSGDLAPSIVHDVLGTSGRALDTSARTFLEPRFGRSLVDVRIHDDAHASRSAAAVGARAYTVGRHIVFGNAEYRPSDPGGMRLLAHEVAHVAQQGGAESRPVAADRSGNGVNAQATPALTPSIRRLQRFAHSDCSDSDLKAKIWPGDGIAKDMVDKAIRVLSTTPINPAVNPLLLSYFMTATPNISAILAVYNKIKADFTSNSYTYECDDDCDSCSFVRSRMGYIGLSPNIHLCMNKLGGADSKCFGYLIVHEFAHRSAHCADNAYCHYGCCSPTACAESLSPSDALDNADSYGAFANDLYTLSV